MTDRSASHSVIHDTFSLERIYPATPSRVFAAFASAEAKNAWRATSELENPHGGASLEEFDFRPGGRERFSRKARRAYRYDALYYDIVVDQRIIYTYEMYADDVRISVSVATIEFANSGAGTALTWTEQGVYLDGIDGAQAPAMRVGGTTKHLDSLTWYLQHHPAGMAAKETG